MIENKYEAIKTINQSKAVRITLSPFYFESKFKRETLGHFCSRPICNKCSVYPASPGCKICGPNICTGEVTWAGSGSESAPLFGESGAEKSAFIGSLITNSCERIAWGSVNFHWTGLLGQRVVKVGQLTGHTLVRVKICTKY